ncbi:MAG: L,D-transpeptidase, partial [Lachnospiraceae bacterium]
DAEGGDIGQNYVEIDLSAQHLYVHQAGQVTEESDFVSGNLAKGHATPAGIYGLTYKERDATLRGETYESHVDYWMPFNGNIGMHDAGWRKEFGGDIYLTKGSHGCVNLPTKKAERIYELVEKGMPVICYY